MSRHGKLKEGNTRITFVASVEEKEELAALAKKDGRSLGNYLTRLLSGEEEIAAFLRARELLRIAKAGVARKPAPTPQPPKRADGHSGGKAKGR